MRSSPRGARARALALGHVSVEYDVGEGYRNALRFPMEHVPFQSPEDQEWVFGKTATTLFRFGE